MYERKKDFHSIDQRDFHSIDQKTDLLLFLSDHYSSLCFVANYDLTDVSILKILLNKTFIMHYLFY